MLNLFSENGLQELKVQGNPIESHLSWSDSNLTALPALLFANNTSFNLTFFNLSGNSFGQLPPNFCSSSLANVAVVDLSHNNLTAFPTALFYCLSLASLDLSHNPRQGHEFAAGNGAALEALSNLAELKLAHVPLNNQADFFRSILVLGSLLTLDVRSTGISELPNQVITFMSAVDDRTCGVQTNSTFANPNTLLVAGNMITNIYWYGTNMCSPPGSILAQVAPTLRNLILDANYNLNRLPPEIGLLRNLESLLISSTSNNFQDDWWLSVMNLTQLRYISVRDLSTHAQVDFSELGSAYFAPLLQLQCLRIKSLNTATTATTASNLTGLTCAVENAPVGDPYSHFECSRTSTFAIRGQNCTCDRCCAHELYEHYSNNTVSCN
jgi:Leucine-rich repeat (LRR) protein